MIKNIDNEELKCHSILKLAVNSINRKLAAKVSIMKNLLMLIMLICVFQSTWAQITLTSSSWYVPGNSFVVQPCESTNSMPAGGGANVTVNYSSLTSIGDTFVQYLVSPASTPYTAAFPEATVAFTSAAGEDYAYYNNTGSKMELIGFANSGFSKINSNPQLVYSFPVNYRDVFNDTFASSFSTRGADIKEFGTQQIVADAYGNITTPTGTYTYLRVKITQKIVDSIFVNGVFAQRETIQSTIYSYMNNTIPCPVFYYSETRSSQGLSRTAYYHVSKRTGINEKSSVVTNESLYPNPAQDQVTVSFDLKSAQQCTFNVYDITGKLATPSFTQQLSQGNHTIPVNTSSLSPGIYSMVVESPGTIATTLKFIVE